MFDSILSTVSSGLTVSTALECTGISIVCGLIIAAAYMVCGDYTKNFVVSLVLLPVIVQVVIMMVNGNLGTGVAVMGAFSLIRFRSAPGSSKDICSIFFAMAAGLATGMGYIWFALLFTAIVCVIFIVLSKTRFGDTPKQRKTLKITVPENLDYTGAFDDLFDKYTRSAELLKVRTTNLGSMYELNYSVVLRDISLEKEFIDELRCRNGNLTIVCSREHSVAESL